MILFFETLLEQLPFEATILGTAFNREDMLFLADLLSREGGH
jgi:hypothetical protein